jgi:hypothetical protein
MTPSEAEDLLLKWYAGEEKGFKYLDYGTFEPHYVVIKKESDNEYTVIASRSTCKDGPFNKERMEKLLGADKLIPTGHSGGWQIDFKNYRSKGCQCGAWATQNPDCHARWCPKG